MIWPTKQSDECSNGANDLHDTYVKQNASDATSAAFLLILTDQTVMTSQSITYRKRLSTLFLLGNMFGILNLRFLFLGELSGSENDDEVDARLTRRVGLWMDSAAGL